MASGTSQTSYGSYDPVGRVWTSTQTTGGTAYPFSSTYDASRTPVRNEYLEYHPPEGIRVY